MLAALVGGRAGAGGAAAQISRRRGANSFLPPSLLPLPSLRPSVPFVLPCGGRRRVEGISVRKLGEERGVHKVRSKQRLLHLTKCCISGAGSETLGLPDLEFCGEVPIFFTFVKTSALLLLYRSKYVFVPIQLYTKMEDFISAPPRFAK